MIKYKKILENINKIDNLLISIDIGGTLIKLVIYSEDPSKFIGFDTSNSITKLNKPNMYFYIINNSIYESFLIEFKEIVTNPTIKLYFTGGGACKYENILKKNYCNNEFDSIILGFLKLIKMKNEIFIINGNSKQYINEISDNKTVLLVNIGSGVSILKIETRSNKVIWERISGTSLGGGTFINLCSLLEKKDINRENYNLYVNEIISGDNTEVDLLVQDIYGINNKNILGKKLDNNTIASSFGKFNYNSELKYLFIDLMKTLSAIISIFIKNFITLNKILNYIVDLIPYQYIFEKKNKINNNNKYTKNICNSFLKLIIYNISHIVYLNSKLHGIDNIYFAGNFINSSLIMKNIQTTIKYWDIAGKKNCLFIEHAGFLGCIGKFTPFNIPSKTPGSKLLKI